ncbi:hypothetical protein O1R50_21195 [Glycomyces luteolus]|uniref:TROVE domain-containing protein n=1 Tax=Glycomyces luteolus TaxID=2670330 RepID=A0A9X3SS62_9ACTN|nr:hypothetical protein [Glycomyces luteolus]MDA1362156.1 hypothetical protein [Glycomyces luteolus]
MELVADRTAAEDVLLFVNAAIASTGQREFHSDADAQQWSMEFLHEYMLVNYRDLYAATLTLGVNDRNAAAIIMRLLQSGRDASPEQRAVEGRLIAKALTELPTHRVYHLFTALRKARVNNRRTRAIMREWLAARPDPAFEAVKYRSAFLGAIRHAHMKVEDLPSEELEAFLFGWHAAGRFDTPQFETWRRAHFDRRAVFELPYTVAEGFAAKHRITRAEFLEKIAPQLTRGERLRLQRSAARFGAIGIAADVAGLSRMPLTRLAAYVLALPVEEREQRRLELTDALRAAARRVAGLRAGTWGRVAAVLDDSYSASGSSEKRRRPLVVALAAHFLLRELASAYHPLWLSGDADPIMARARGVTALGERILDGLEERPDLLVVVSDGWDNAPVGMAAEVLRVWEERLDSERKTAVAHLNPVFDAAGLQVRRLSPTTPTVGIRDAEDLPELVEFARFATGRTGIAELRAHIDSRVERWLTEETPCTA